MSVLSSATVDGCLQFTCRVCSITVLGKKNIDSHLDGKKHAAKMVDWEVIGKGFLCSSFFIQSLSKFPSLGYRFIESRSGSRIFA